MIRLADFLATVRSEVSPHLDLLAAIEAKSGEDLEGAERELAALIANMIRAANPDVHMELAAIRAQLDRIEQQQEKIMTSQDDINAAVATDNTLITDLTTQTAAVAAAQQAFAAEIASLQSQGVDTSGLDTANAQLTAAQAPLDAAVSALTAASAPAPSAAPIPGVSN